jgi:hypothetical protein
VVLEGAVKFGKVMDSIGGKKSVIFVVNSFV